MHYRNIGFKTISDFYIDGGENILLDSKNIKDQIKIFVYKSIVYFKEILSVLRFKDNSLLCTILFKEEPNPKIIDKLKSFRWEIKKLPKNPYI